MIRFSIITCTFNAEAVIERTLDSVLEQTHSHLEHLIIDGASKDRTVEMAQHYKTKSDEEDHCHDVIICSEPDGGLYDAMNKAIAKATGDYVLFLNAGDVFPSPDTLEMVAESVGDGESLPAVLYGDTDIVNEEGLFLRHRRLAAPRRLTWRSFMKGMLVCHQAFVVRRALAEPYDLRYRFSADYEWCLRCLKKAKRCAYTGTTLIDYLADGLTDKNHKASLRERYDIMCQYYGTLPTIVRHIGFFARNLKRKLLK